MPSLKLLSLTCHRTDDSIEEDYDVIDTTVEDEPYLLSNNKMIWSVKMMKANDVEDLSEVETILFDESVDIELWDRDSEHNITNDKIGELIIKASQKGLGVQRHEFRRRNARYTLTYKVE